MIGAKQILQRLTSGPSLMDSVCDFIIRPPRSNYDLEDLGPQIFRIGDMGSSRYVRHDFELVNMRGLSLQCSWYKMHPQKCSPCVVYCHANCGSRYDGLEALFLLRHGFSVFTFDFAGSGMSEGTYISLGFYERQDLATVVEFLMMKTDEVCGVALWGRSMGAVAAVMYAAKDPWIRCIVLDSPFSNLRLLIHDIVERHGGRTAQYVPNVIVDGIVGRIRKRIMTRAAFDMDDLDTVKYASQCNVPSLLFHGEDDDFVSMKHCFRIRDAFAGPCLQELVPGGHNDEREDEIQNLIVGFLRLYLVEKPNGEQEAKQALLAHEKLTSAVHSGAVSPPKRPTATVADGARQTSKLTPGFNSSPSAMTASPGDGDVGDESEGEYASSKARGATIEELQVMLSQPLSFRKTHLTAEET